MLKLLLTLIEVNMKIVVKTDEKDDTEQLYNSHFEKLLSKDHIVVVYKKYCPYSMHTIETLEKKKIPFTKYERKENEKFSEYVNKKFNYFKSPLIVIGGQFFGGDSTLQAALEKDPDFLLWPNVRET